MPYQSCNLQPRAAHNVIVIGDVYSEHTNNCVSG